MRDSKALALIEIITTLASRFTDIKLSSHGVD